MPVWSSAHAEISCWRSAASSAGERAIVRATVVGFATGDPLSSLIGRFPGTLSGEVSAPGASSGEREALVPGALSGKGGVLVPGTLLGKGVFLVPGTLSGEGCGSDKRMANMGRNQVPGTHPSMTAKARGVGVKLLSDC